MLNALFLIALLAIGYLIKRVGLLKNEDAAIITKLVLYITLPCTVIMALTFVDINPDWAFLPISSFLVGIACYGVSYLTYKSSKMDREKGGAFIIGSSSMNTALFMYPFFSAYLGSEGLARIVFFDVGQIFLMYGLAYYVAITYGGKGGNGLLRRLLSFPPFYALLIGLWLNLTETSLWMFEGFISMLDSATVPLIMIAMGMSLELPEESKSFGWVAISLAIRFLLSLGVACALIFTFGLEDLEALTVLIGSAAPPAVLTMVYSAEEGLDSSFTALLVSTGTLVGVGLTVALFAIVL